eukprot:scaffold24786_cov91-Isochrysis_galbana.AAC.3
MIPPAEWTRRGGGAVLFVGGGAVPPMRTNPSGQLSNPSLHRLRSEGGVDSVCGAQLERLASGLVAHAEPTAPKDSQRLAGTQAAALEHGAVGGGGSAAEGRRLNVGDAVGDAAQVAVGAGQGDELGKRAVLREAGLLLPLAYRWAATAALAAAAAREDEGNSHAVTHLQRADALAHVNHAACQLVPWDKRQPVLEYV